MTKISRSTVCIANLRAWQLIQYIHIPFVSLTAAGNIPNPLPQACRGEPNGDSGRWCVDLVEVWLHSPPVPCYQLHTHARPWHCSVYSQSPWWGIIVIACFVALVVLRGPSLLPYICHPLTQAIIHTLSLSCRGYSINAHMLINHASMWSFISPSPRIHSVFGSEKRSSHMPIQISTVVVAHNALWIGTENGVLLTFPFNSPTLVAEESGWEVIKVCKAFFSMFIWEDL